ncbi:MAG TPA: hypothetical protein DEB31_00295 [Clostridiales bacterium]|nr:hypothetical protein [Clostridiales bacterium]
MVTSLSSLFRISLSRGANIIPASDELAHVESYIKIQQTRYSDVFEYRMDIQPETLDCATIKLVLQPIVENSIYHSMKYMDGEGEIAIRAYIEDSGLYLEVADNGLGMRQEAADRLLTEETPETASGKGNGVGLKNVNDRIRLYFGREYGLQIISEPDAGTTVRVRLPVRSVQQARDGSKGVDA